MDKKRWVFYEEIEPKVVAEGVTRRVLAYNDELMCVENTFKTGAIGEIHHHPHTQITYVVSGEFKFNIDGEEHIVGKGDTLLKTKDIKHGCKCLEEGILLDIFNPKREDFL